MKTQDVVMAVLNGEVDAGLAKIEESIRRRRNLLVSTWEIGDRVRFTGNVKPGYLYGEMGTITGFFRSRLRVEMDKPIGRFGKVLRVTPSLLEKVD